MNLFTRLKDLFEKVLVKTGIKDYSIYSEEQYVKRYSNEAVADKHSDKAMLKKLDDEYK